MAGFSWQDLCHLESVRGFCHLAFQFIGFCVLSVIKVVFLKPWQLAADTT
jgi:hypothetical protein